MTKEVSRDAAEDVRGSLLPAPLEVEILGVSLATQGGTSSPEQPKRTREKRLLAVVAILVVSWLIVKVWADLFDVFVRKVLKIPKDSFVRNAIVAVIFTAAVVWILYATSLDDMLGN
jgi:threonine/homoserine/homoserine lactone efflux protein